MSGTKCHLCLRSLTEIDLPRVAIFFVSLISSEFSAM